VKSLIFLAVLIVGPFILGACGDGSSEADSPIQPTSTTTNPTPASPNQVEQQLGPFTFVLDQDGSITSIWCTSAAYVLAAQEMVFSQPIKIEGKKAIGFTTATCVELGYELDVINALLLIEEAINARLSEVKATRADELEGEVKQLFREESARLVDEGKLPPAYTNRIQGSYFKMEYRVGQVY